MNQGGGGGGGETWIYSEDRAKRICGQTGCGERKKKGVKDDAETFFTYASRKMEFSLTEIAKLKQQVLRTQKV